jgi:hypothetical protein
LTQRENLNLISIFYFSINSLLDQNLFQKIVDKKNLGDKLIENYKSVSQIVIPVIEEYVEKSLDNRIRLEFTQLQQNLKV